MDLQQLSKYKELLVQQETEREAFQRLLEREEFVPSYLPQRSSQHSLGMRHHWGTTI